MLQNYIKIAVRSLSKRKFYALLNIFSLSLGITFSLLIGAYIFGEIQVNAHLQSTDNQYFIQSKWKEESMGLDFTTAGPLAKMTAEAYPDLIANYYRFDGINANISAGEKHFNESIQLGDSTLLEMYNFPLKYGDAATALIEPHTLVVSEKIAQKYFGKSNVINEELTIESFSGERRAFVVKGVLGNVPRNTVTNVTGPAEIFTSTGSLAYFGRSIDTWGNIYVCEFLEIKDGVHKEQVETALAATIQKHAPDRLKTNLTPYLTSLKDFHWNDNGGLVKNKVYALGIIALFILLMAIVNFVNLMIGHSASRIREIAVRKVLGSEKRQLVFQYLMESTVLAALATVFSLLFYQVLRPIFSDSIGAEIVSLWSFPLHFIAIPILVALIIGILSGIYPAFVLSSFPTTDSLKGKMHVAQGNQFFRRFLIASQFSIALFVCCAAVVISKQVDHFFDADLGYDKSAIVSLVMPRDWSREGIEKMEALRSEFSKLATVDKASFSYEIPNGNNGHNWGVNRIEEDPNTATTMKILQTDQMYAETYGIQLMDGNFFQLDEHGHVDIAQIVMNEKAVHALGFKDETEALGKQVKLRPFPMTMTISGITKNFNFESLRNEVKPIVFIHCRATNAYRYLSLKLNKGDIQNALTSIEKTYKNALPNTPFNYNFMDDTLAKLYASEMQLQKAGKLATTLAIIIVLLGILGMVSLSISRRTKELGVRKILGASTYQIISLFLKEYLIILLGALLFAFPVSYYFMESWLQNYAFHITLNWNTFTFITLAFSLIISILVGFQTLRAAWLNPMESLRND